MKKSSTVAENPFEVFRKECEDSLASASKKLFPEIHFDNYAIEKPPNPEFGQLASSLCFELAKKLGTKPFNLAEQFAKTVEPSKFSLISKVSPAGGGYINFHVNFPRFSTLTLESAKALDTSYGFVRTEHPLNIIVEHTSANPLHPLTIGTARNPILGDTLSRLLARRGNSVSRHFYVDDVGRQTSVAAYGYEKLGKPRPEGKPDQFIGKIYTITSCLVEINRLKKELEAATAVSTSEEIAKITRELDDWVSIAAELKEKHSELFEKLLDKIVKDRNPEESIKILNKAYELKEEKARQLIRQVSELCLKGFTETLARIDVTFDSWDWESDLVWTGHVNQIFQKLKQSRYSYQEGGVVKFDAEKVVAEQNLWNRLGLREGHEIPPLTLGRADGTTLYTTRDTAYSLWKFEKASKVINVIGMEQSLAQLQLKIALYALSFGKFADNLIHFAYNLVTLPGYKMSSRRGRYITLDEVMDEAVRRAYEEVSKRSPQLSEREKKEIANFVGLGAVRYALIEVDTSKPVMFTWDRVLNFEKNSAPYIQYTHARACSIMRKATDKTGQPSYKLLTENLEHEITLTISTFPDVFTEASEYLKPNLIPDYANSLADKFNTFYNAFQVIRAEPEGLSNARLALTNAVRITLRNALTLIGILAPEKM